MLGLNCRFAIFCDIKKFRLDLIHNAINLLLDNPHLSNREVARQIGVSELSIRHWKKQPFWETERQKLISERVEAMGINKQAERDKFTRELMEQNERLDKLYKAIYINIMQALRMSNNALAELSKMDNATEACRLAVKAGTHVQSKVAINGIGTIMKIIGQEFQINLLLEYFEKMDSNDDD